MMKICAVSILCLSLVVGEHILPRQVTDGIEATRLVGIPSGAAGRLEVQVQGVWGTVCDDFFNTIAARVVCRSLGFPTNETERLAREYFTPADPTTPIFLDDVRCRGNESSISECRHRGIGRQNCHHREDVGITCVIRRIEAVRLEGAANESLGRLEVLTQGVWRTVCDSAFTMPAASVICRSLGFPPNEYGILNRRHFIPAADSVPILHVHIWCHGVESALSECNLTISANLGRCDHEDDVGVICAPGEIDAVRLVDGPIERAGRLEVLVDGLWGTVCNDRFDDNAAEVVCRSLGFPINESGLLPVRFFSRPDVYTTRILLDDVTCRGNEPSLNQCKHSEIGIHDCGHDENVGVTCALLQISGIRLVDGQNPQAGRLEVMFLGNWGTVCGDSFDNDAAVVACRSLGLQSNVTGVIAANYFYPAYRNASINLVGVICTGSESSLSECLHTLIGEAGSCRHPNDVGIACGLGAIESVRLAGGFTKQAGRLEVFSQGIWGTVCTDLFDRNAASVVCRSLGLQDNPIILSPRWFNDINASTPMILDDVRCVGNESSLNSCDHRRIGDIDCSYHDDVAIICGQRRFQIVSQVRLVDGRTPQDGCLQVFVNGTWGNVCGHMFTNQSAQVVCRMLGFPHLGTELITRGCAGSALAMVITNVNCVGNEAHLDSCEFDVNYHSCRYFDGAAVRCG